MGTIIGDYIGTTIWNPSPHSLLSTRQPKPDVEAKTYLLKSLYQGMITRSPLSGKLKTPKDYAYLNWGSKY